MSSYENEKEKKHPIVKKFLRKFSLLPRSSMRLYRLEKVLQSCHDWRVVVSSILIHINTTFTEPVGSSLAECILHSFRLVC